MSHFTEQPGLEPLPDQPGLEPVYADSHHTEASQSLLGWNGGKTSSSVAHSYPYPYSPQPESQTSSSSPTTSRKRRILWIIVAVSVVLIIVGAVLGGVLGPKAARSRVDAKPDDSKTSANSTLLRKKSPLAATGWRLNGKSNIQLFYQGKDDFVYYSAWDSGHDSWEEPAKLKIGAASDTPMAAAVIFQNAVQDGAPPNPQVQFYYRNASNWLNGENFQSSFPEGLPDSIDTFAFEMSSGSNLAAYWPVVVYEGKPSGLQTVWYDPHVIRYDDEPQSLSQESVVGSSGTPVVALPLQAVHPTFNATKAPDLKLLYRRDDGRIYEFDRWSNDTVTKNDVLPGFTLSSGASMSGFTNARAKSSTGALNTYIVYQDPHGKILYGANTNSTGWQGPFGDTVFEGADNPTSLACVTAAGSTDPDIPLTAATDLNKCYFQRNGTLVEVLFDGDGWSELGEIPMPT